MFIKTIKIFLQLKWDETLGKDGLGGLSSLFQFMMVAIVTCFIAISVAHGVGWLAVTIFNMPTDKQAGHCAIGIGILALTFIASLIIYWIVMFFKWIRSNWRMAKKIAKGEMEYDK